LIEKDTITKADLGKITLKIKEDFFKSTNSYKITIFLCGGDITKPNTTRAKVAEALSDWYGVRYYDIIYPEDIFDELLYSSHGKDLLSLENMLADNVDVIVIIPESPGSFTELGAFANTLKLREKIVCLVDKKYRKKKSFINQGPLKLIKHVNKQGVVYIEPTDLALNFHKVKSAIRKVKSSSSKIDDKIGLLQLDNFLLPIIYLLEPVSKEDLIQCVTFANDDNVNPIQSTTVALTSLTKKKFIELTTHGYKLTQVGLNNFLDLRATRDRVKTQDETVALDNMRLEILNLKYRQKKLKV